MGEPQQDWVPGSREVRPTYRIREALGEDGEHVSRGPALVSALLLLGLAAAVLAALAGAGYLVVQVVEAVRGER
ncbi:hypothetical protein [Nocardioides sp. SYSU D00038]|uniref:hypothetical protein n=1 Tax=Nocardioides sp. SYSU D00038 TaxID=2812554 RepID=UPI001968249A|nr:hypothetical protein [Nocardioides sp. SYSU D00038]